MKRYQKPPQRSGCSPIATWKSLVPAAAGPPPTDLAAVGLAGAGRCAGGRCHEAGDGRGHYETTDHPAPSALG